ncbi:EamA family transporter [Arcobacter sp. CECT 8983]|uniref:DMT family transporter n=1 Tax=Arcobacter sp. CECT 8983 TaxID=2044508 RepID=UPI00100C1CA9|nr:DMT family transporter [Arcobacter sp. CECT 8983]RXJ89197.1 EamA family transporter [Arcobacter sp. CECT 8983]
MLGAQRVYILLALCVLFWSGNFIVGRYVNESIEAIELSFFRWLFTLIFLLPSLFFINIQRIKLAIKENFKILIVLSFLGITLFNTIVYLALNTTTATNALLINSITPIIILILSYFILKAKITKLQTTGIILSTVGVVFLVLKGDFTNLLSIVIQEGDLLILISSLTWATYSVLLKFRPKELTHLELFVTLVFLGFILILPFYFYQGYSIEREIILLEDQWHIFIYVSLFPSVLSFYFWNTGVEVIGASKAGQFAHLMPIFGSILAFIFLGEKLHTYHIAGAVMIALGIYLSLFLKTNRITPVNE